MIGLTCIILLCLKKWLIFDRMISVDSDNWYLWTGSKEMINIVVQREQEQL